MVTVASKPPLHNSPLFLSFQNLTPGELGSFLFIFYFYFLISVLNKWNVITDCVCLLFLSRLLLTPPCPELWAGLSSLAIWWFVFCNDVFEGYSWSYFRQCRSFVGVLRLGAFSGRLTVMYYESVAWRHDKPDTIFPCQCGHGYFNVTGNPCTFHTLLPFEQNHLNVAGKLCTTHSLSVGRIT